MKFGCFRVKKSVDIIRLERATEGCTLYGSASKLLTQTFITKLKRNRVLKKTLIFLDHDNNLEVGRITLVYKLKVEELEDKIYEDVSKIEKVYYDPFETDEGEVNVKLAKVEQIVVKRQIKVDVVMEEMDKRVDAMRGLAIDHAMPRKSKEEMDETNQKLLHE